MDLSDPMLTVAQVAEMFGGFVISAGGDRDRLRFLKSDVTKFLDQSRTIPIEDASEDTGHSPMTVQMVAKRWRASRTEIRSFIKAGLLPAFDIKGTTSKSSRMMIRYKDVIAFENSRMVNNASEDTDYSPMTVRMVAERWRVGRAKIYAFIKAGLIPAFDTKGPNSKSPRMMVRYKDVIAFEKSRMVNKR